MVFLLFAVSSLLLFWIASVQGVVEHVKGIWNVWSRAEDNCYTLCPNSLTTRQPFITAQTKRHRRAVANVYFGVVLPRIMPIVWSRKAAYHCSWRRFITAKCQHQDAPARLARAPVLRRYIVHNVCYQVFVSVSLEKENEHCVKASMFSLSFETPCTITKLAVSSSFHLHNIDSNLHNVDSIWSTLWYKYAAVFILP